MPQNTLLLVDGMAAVYRAHFAIKGMSTSDGRPSNAVFGFIRMIDSLRRTWKPTHIAVVFDGGLPPERMTLVPEYKANRQPMPDDMRAQLDGINRYLAAARVGSVRLDACEADDVMATMAVRAARDSADVLLATHDKDLFQLVNSQIKIVPVTGKNEIMGEQEVLAKTGVPPRLIPAWLALIGDSADNIKGIAGVGPKTATKLLNQYGDIDSIVAHSSELKGVRLGESIAGGRDLLSRNLKMVTLYTELDNVPDWKRFEACPPAVDELLRFYDEFEFDVFAKPLRAPELF